MDAKHVRDTMFAYQILKVGQSHPGAAPGCLLGGGGQNDSFTAERGQQFCAQP